MRISLVFALAGLLGSVSANAWAQGTHGPSPTVKYPPFRLAGPAPVEPAAPVAQAPATPVPATAPPATPPTANTPPANTPPANTPPATTAPTESDGALDALAQQHYNAGVEMFRNGQYEASRVEFEAAYKLLPLPDLLHNLSMAAEQQKKFDDALAYEERFLTAATNLTHTERTESKNRIAKLRAAADGAGQSTGTGVEGSGGKGRTPTGALALIGIGGAMLLTGIGCGAGALVTQKKLENGEPLYQHEIDELTSRGRALNFTGISFDVAGGVALVAGSAWALWARTHGPKPQTASLKSLSSLSMQTR